MRASGRRFVRDGNSIRSDAKEQTMLAKILGMMVLTTFVIGLSGCNTMEGMGRDVSAGGDKVTKEAAEHKRY
jgi:predicted small secreted protein